MPNWKKVLTSGSIGDLSSLNISGDLNVENNILVSGSIDIDSSTHAILTLDRNATSNDAAIYFSTNGSNDWKIGTGLIGSDNSFTIRFGNSSNIFRLSTAGYLNFSGNIDITQNLIVTGSITANGTLTVNNSLGGTGLYYDGTDLSANASIYANTFTGSLLRLDETGTGMRITNVGGFEPNSGVFNIFGNSNVTFGAGGSGASYRVLTMFASSKDAHFTNNVVVTGSITSTDITIDDWGSVSASLASLDLSNLGGSGTDNYVARFSGSNALEDSTIINTDTYTHVIHSSNGNDIFKVSGSNGEQIIVNDSVSSFPFQVNNGSGLPIFRVSSSAEVDFYGPLHVGTNVLYQGGVNNNFIDLDYDESGDRDNSVAIGSVQSIHMFLDTNNNETGNYFGIFNGLTRTDTAEDSDAIFLVNEDGDVKLDSLGVGTAASGVTGEIRATNDVTAYYSSDSRLKTDVKPIEDPLDKLKEINGVTFNWIPKEGIHSHEGSDIGVIAQEIEAVLPDLVQTRDNGYKAVQYEKIVALLIETNKELLRRVEVLENKIK